MTVLGVEGKQTRQSTWMIPVISDLIRFEYEALVRADPPKRIQAETSHRHFWNALLSGNYSVSCRCFNRLANDLSAIELDVLALGSIDATIFDSLSEMILVRSKTQKTKSRSELKMLMKAAVLKGEVSGWWHTHH